jgi:hypothetical protein
MRIHTHNLQIAAQMTEARAKQSDTYNDALPGYIQDATAMRSLCGKVVADLDTINTMSAAINSGNIPESFVEVTDNLNQRIFDNLTEIKSKLDILLDTYFFLVNDVKNICHGEVTTEAATGLSTEE